MNVKIIKTNCGLGSSIDQHEREIQRFINGKKVVSVSTIYSGVTVPTFYTTTIIYE